ncbi:MAG: hypothetical protein WCG16_09155 [Methylococcales bacterium]
MTIEKALLAGKAGNELSKKITGTSEVSAGRTAVAVGAGALTGSVMGGAIAISVTTVGATVAAPVVIPLAVASAVFAGVCSLFD